MLLEEKFERWLAGLPTDLHDPTLRNVTIDGATVFNGNLIDPRISGATIVDPVFLGVPIGPTAPVGTNTGQLATSAALVAQGRVVLSRFVSILQTSGQVVAGTVAGTFLLGTQSQVLAVGAQSLIPPQTTFIQASDLFPFLGSSPKLRIRAQICTNSTAPTGNFTVGLYPITGTSGAAGGITYAIGPVVAGSTATTLSLGANANVFLLGTEFVPPSDGLYAIGLVTTLNTAASSHVNICAQLRSNYSTP